MTDLHLGRLHQIWMWKELQADRLIRQVLFKHLGVSHKSNTTVAKTRGLTWDFRFVVLFFSVGCWSLSQLSLGERRGTPWTGRQSITGPHRDKWDTRPCTPMLPLTPRVNLEPPRNPTYMIWTVGGSRSTGQNPRIHGENMQTLHRKASRNLFLWGDGAHRFY